MGKLTRTFSLLFLAWIGVALVPLAAPAQTTLETTCDRVIDGWTLHSPDFGEIRFFEIEAPEGKERTDLGEKVKKELASLAEGKRISLEFEGPTEDPEGRLLAYVKVGELGLNGWLVKHGYAKVSSAISASQRQASLLDLEREARENKRGIWAPAKVTPTAPVASPPPPEKKRIIGSKKSRYYYRPGQRYYDQVESRHRVYFDTEEAARKAGFRPYLKD
jgi:micrococcal nuclease